MTGEVTDEDLQRKETVFFFSFEFSSSFSFSFSFFPQSFFPLGLAIIPSRIYLENYSSQIIFIMQPALLGTVLPEWKRI